MCFKLLFSHAWQVVFDLSDKTVLTLELISRLVHQGHHPKKKWLIWLLRDSCEKEILLKCYWIRESTRIGTPTTVWDSRQTGLLETGQIPACSGTAWQMSVCPKLCTPGLNTLLYFPNATSMWGRQTTDSNASKKQMTSSQDRAMILQPSPRINAISLWMTNGLAKGEPGECALGKVKHLFRYYSFSVDILSKRKHLCCSV